MKMSTVLEKFTADGLSRLHIGTPARVETYDAELKMVSVQPLIKDDEGRTLPIIERVPVMFPRGGGFEFTWPLAAGDVVWLSFCERSLDEWLERGGLVQPTDPRQCDLSDAVAWPGVGPLAATTPTVQIVVSGGIVQLGAPDGDFVALASLVLAELAVIRTWANLHTHGGAVAAPALGAAGPVAATLVRAT